MMEFKSDRMTPDGNDIRKQSAEKHGPERRDTMRTLQKTRGRYLMILVAMAGLVSSSFGILTNTGGIFFSPIAAELGQPTAAVNLTLTISNISFAIAGIFSARWIGPKNYRPAVLWFTLLFAGFTALLSACHSVVSLYLFNAVRGFSAGLIGNVLATSILGRWFLSDTGFITSLALGCSGIVGAVFNPILASVIQSAGWRTAYLVSAGVILLLNLPAILFPITFLPEDSGMEPIGSRPSSEETVRNQPDQPDKASGSFILILTLLAFSLASFVSSTPQLFKPLSNTYGLGETGILMMSVVLVMNTAGKFLFGFLTDRIGVRRSVLIYGLIIASGIAFLLLIRVSGVMLLSAGMIGLCYSIPTVGAVMICRELYSPDRYSRVFPKLNLSVSIANALGYPILGFIFDRTGRYDGALILVFSAILISVAVVFLVYRIAARSRSGA